MNQMLTFVPRPLRRIHRQALMLLHQDRWRYLWFLALDQHLSRLVTMAAASETCSALQVEAERV
jgi:hypothetical protein